MSNSANASLFDDDAAQRFSLVETLATVKPSSKAQQDFQRLVAKIEGKREHLKLWQAYELRYNQRLASELMPVQAQMRAGQRSMVLLIDELLSVKAPGRPWGRVQRAKLAQVLMNLLTDLLEESADLELTALHDKYSDISYEELQQSEMDITHSVLKNVFDMDIDDDHGATTPEELLQQAQRKLQQRVAEEARTAEEKKSAPSGKRSKAAAAKVEAAQLKREQAAKEVSQSLREVYRKLASALHPDRETDNGVRERKTQMMQRVNQAYAANDLLTLLGLQLEIEQIDAAHLASASPQRVAHYNQILREQLKELEHELEHCTVPFRRILGWGRGAAGLLPATVDQRLSADIAMLRANVRQLEQDLVAFRDPQKLRTMLKHYRLQQDFENFDDFGSLDDLMGLFQAPMAAPAPRGKKRGRSNPPF